MKCAKVIREELVAVKEDILWNAGKGKGTKHFNGYRNARKIAKKGERGCQQRRKCVATLCHVCLSQRRALRTGEKKKQQGTKERF